jgi:hypothetical protein
MSCCGSKRALVTTYVSPAQPAPKMAPVPARSPTPPPNQAVRAAHGASAPASMAVPETLFEYVGSTGMTVIGPMTGRRYRFDRPGATIAVDRRDAPGVGAVPNVRQAGQR